MKSTVVVVGATGHLGQRITDALTGRGAQVRALVRASSPTGKTEALERGGVEVVRVDLADADGLTRACAGASCVVSALLGLHDVMVEAQTALAGAAAAAGVPRFIPSDYAIDFTKLPAGNNRNLDLHREFQARLESIAIASTSVLIGAFTELLTYGMPLLDRKARRVSYWQDADQPLDFTTMDDTAAFTAEAALDPSTPRFLRAAGDRLSARELAHAAGELDRTEYDLVRAGSLEELTAMIRRERAAAPASEAEAFPRWQGMQYLHDMFDGRGLLVPLDNDRYPGIAWTGVRQVLGSR